MLDELYQTAEQMMSETSPVTTEVLISGWEREFNIPIDPNLTMEQRRGQLLANLQGRGACTPTRLAKAVSSVLGGVRVDVTERTGKNRFTVNIRDVVPSIVPAVAVIERMKPAHLIYVLQVATQMVAEADIKIAVALARSENYVVEVQQ